MRNYSIHGRTVAPEALIDAVIGLANSPRPVDKSDLSDVIDKGSRYTNAVIQLGKQLELIETSNPGLVANPAIKEDARKMSPDQGFVLINQQVQRYRPFMTLLSFLNKGYSSERAAQSVQTLYEIDTQPDVVEKQFIDLGRYGNLLSKDGEPKPTIDVETLPTTYVENLRDALESEAKARLFVEEWLGEEVVAYADSESIEKIQDSLFTFKDSPDTAIVETVVGAENITRELAEDEGKDSTNYFKANGIGQLASKMRSDGLVLKRHVHGANYLGSMRTPGAHGKEKETLESWHVEPEVALEVIIAAISYVRSIYWFPKEKRQVL